MDRNLLLEIIKDAWDNLEFWDWTWIDCIDICNILWEYRDRTDEDARFYIEELTAQAGEGEWFPYLDYYDDTINQVVLARPLEWQERFEDEEDLADFIIWMDLRVKEVQRKIKVMSKSL